MATFIQGSRTGAARPGGAEGTSAGGRGTDPATGVFSSLPGLRLPALSVLLLVALGGVGGCATFYDPPEVRVAGVRITSLGLTAGTVSLELDVHNPNRRSLRMQGVRYRLELEGLGDAGSDGTNGTDDRAGSDGSDDRVLLTEGFDAEGVVLEGGESTQVAVEMPFEYETVGRTIRALFRGEDVRYHLDAEVRMDGPVGEIRAPIRESGSILDLRPNP